MDESLKKMIADGEAVIRRSALNEAEFMQLALAINGLGEEFMDELDRPKAYALVFRLMSTISLGVYERHRLEEENSQLQATVDRQSARTN